MTSINLLTDRKKFKFNKPSWIENSESPTKQKKLKIMKLGMAKNQEIEV